MCWLSCSHCSKNIEDNEVHYSINFHKEVYEAGAMTVLQADGVLAYCSKCADLFDFTKIAVPLKDETIS